MKGHLRSKPVLSLVALVMIAAAIAVPSSGNIMHSRAAPSTVGSEPTWALPFPTGTSVSIGPKGIHGDNFRSIQDDRTHTVYQFANPTDPDSLDLVLEPEQTGTSSIATTPLASGTVLAVWAKCHVVLIDYGNGWWSIYLHLTNISVSSGDSVTVNTKIGYPTTNVQPSKTCGNEMSSAEHVHFAFLNGSGRNGSYVPMLGRVLCGRSIVEQNNDPTDIILQGLTQTKDQVFNVPACGVSPPGTITEFPIPTSNSNPDGITAGPDGNLWFTESSGYKIGKMTPSGTFTEYPVPTSNIGLDNPTTGPDGNLWFTAGNGNQIGRITPTGTITEFPLPNSGSFPNYITTGPDGNLWFTASGINQIERITTSGTVTGEFPVPTSNSGPRGITAGPDGNLWFTEVNGNQIGRITPTGTITEFPVPTSGSYPWEIILGPDGNLWFTEFFSVNIGRITPNGSITEFPLPNGGNPDGITAGPLNSVWFAEWNGNKIGRITP